MTGVVAAAALVRQRMEQGDLAGGCALARQHLEQRPDDGPVHLLLAMACVQQQSAEPALKHARRAAELCPRDAQAQLVLGRAYKLQHALPEAVAAYRRALVLQPDYAEALVSLGIALKHGGDLEGALQCHERALALRPAMAAARANLAYAQAASAEHALQAAADAAPRVISNEVLEGARAAAALEPGNAQLHFNLGLLLSHALQHEAAIDAFNLALGAAPGREDLCLHLGHALTNSGGATLAIALYEGWLQRNGATPAVMRALAQQLTREGRSGEALAWAERAMAQDPDPAAWLQLCHSFQQCRRLPEALAAGHRALELGGGRWALHSVPLMVANYLLEDPQALAALHVQAGTALALAVQEVAPTATRTTTVVAPALASRPRPARGRRRLRIGYVSADFLSHSVAFFIAPLLQHHDRQRFEVWCYHNRSWGDATTDRLRGWADHWVPCAHLSDAALAQRVQADGIDVLVDLSGHTAGARLPVFARGPAPLQLSYLGYPTLSGVPHMHHRVSDGVIDPGDQPDIGRERPLVLPRSMFCYRPPEADEAPEVEPLQRRKAPVFGSFNNVAKLSDRTLALWAQVLRAVPGSRLLLKAASAADAATRSSVETFMASQGVEASRLMLRPRLAERRAHLAAYGEIDVALDSFPYNGATTTCEALWMGLPVLTLAGRTHPSRMGASLLRAAGQQRWVCHDEVSFLTQACALAADESGRAAWRTQARALLCDSELRDERGFVAAFETAVERAWDGETPPSPAGAGLESEAGVV